MKDLLESFQNQKNQRQLPWPLTERMIDKDFVAYTEFGNSREYYPLV
jgi:hypothetical protein